MKNIFLYTLTILCFTYFQSYGQYIEDCFCKGYVIIPATTSGHIGMIRPYPAKNQKLDKGVNFYNNGSMGFDRDQEVYFKVIEIELTDVRINKGAKLKQYFAVETTRTPPGKSKLCKDKQVKKIVNALNIHLKEKDSDHNVGHITKLGSGQQTLGPGSNTNFKDEGIFIPELNEYYKLYKIKVSKKDGKAITVKNLKSEKFWLPCWGEKTKIYFHESSTKVNDIPIAHGISHSSQHKKWFQKKDEKIKIDNPTRAN